MEKKIVYVYGIKNGKKNLIAYETKPALNGNIFGVAEPKVIFKAVKEIQKKGYEVILNEDSDHKYKPIKNKKSLFNVLIDNRPSNQLEFKF